MVVGAGVGDAKTQRHQIEETRFGQRHAECRKIIAYGKFQLIGAYGQRLPG
jgi:hypothetical protein